MLTTKDRAILHLYYLKGEQLHDRPSDASTQEGIASALGLNRTHVTRTLQPLVREGRVEQEKGRVTGKDRRLVYYRLTPAGLVRAESLLKSVAERTVTVEDENGRRTVRLADLIELRPDLPPLKLVDSIGEVIRLPPVMRVTMANARLDLKAFIDRDNELLSAADFLESNATVLAVFANYGYGSSTFLKKVATSLWEGHLLWYDLELDSSAVDARSALSAFAMKLGLGDDWTGLGKEAVLLCFDNYHEVSQEVVDILYELKRSLKGGRAKLAVAIRGETPSYNRFYLKDDVCDGTVVEIRFHRFNEEFSRRLLALDLDDEVFSQVYAMTRGQPLALALLRDGDEAGLRKIRLSEEARYMMYLRGRARGPNDLGGGRKQ